MHFMHFMHRNKYQTAIIIALLLNNLLHYPSKQRLLQSRNFCLCFLELLSELSYFFIFSCQCLVTIQLMLQQQLISLSEFSQTALFLKTTDWFSLQLKTLLKAVCLQRLLVEHTSLYLKG
jgi:hypothetical protein